MGGGGGDATQALAMRAASGYSPGAREAVMVRVGVVWDRTVAFLGDRIGTLLPIALATLVLPGALSSVLQPIRATAGNGASGAIGLVVLASGLVSLWGQLAVTALVLDQAGGGAALRHGGRRLPAMLGIALVLLIAVLLATAPLSWLAMVASGARMDMEGVRMAMSGGRRGTLALLAIIYAVLGLWIGARLSVLMPVVVEERLGLRAIPRAYALTRGLGLKLVGVILLYGAVLSIVSYAAQTVFGSVMLLVAGGEGTVTVASVVTALLVSCVTAAFSVLACVFLALLYRAVRVSREGGPWA